MEVANIGTRQQLLLVIFVGVLIEADNAINAFICEVLHGGGSELLGGIATCIAGGRGAVELVSRSNVLGHLLHSLLIVAARDVECGRQH